MACSDNCVCPACLERAFRDNDDLAALYLKVRKQIEQREESWAKQDEARAIRRKIKRETLDNLVFRIDLESKRRMSSGFSGGSSGFSI
jgi:hypothetical protein